MAWQDPPHDTQSRDGPIGSLELHVIVAFSPQATRCFSRTASIQKDAGRELLCSHRLCHVAFNQESLAVGLSYRELSLGLRVTYGIFFATGAKIPTDINVMPALGQTEKTQDRENVRSARVGEFGAV